MTELLSEPDPENDADLSNMTKTELLAYAEANGIEGVSSSMKKAEIYSIIVGGKADGTET